MTKHIFARLRQSTLRLRRNTSGATFVEYALLVSVFAIGLIAATNLLKGSVSTAFSTIGSTITSNASDGN